MTDPKTDPGPDPRVNPNLGNYFIGDQYRCQEKCITEGFWTEARIKAENNNGSKPVLEWALTQLDPAAALDILDIGCGPSQKMFKFFGGNHKVRITGLDSPEATELARRFNPRGAYHACDLDSDASIAGVSAQLGLFDVIFCLDVIEHVLFPEKMLRLIKKHARPGARIYITTLERDLSEGAGPLHVGSYKPEHVREWNATELARRFIEAMGFTVQRLKLTPLGAAEFCQTLLCTP